MKGAAAIARQHGVALRSVADYASGFRAAATGIVEDQKYTNPYADVHRKAKAFKDRATEASKNDAELRESKLAQEFKGIVDREPD